MGAGRAVVGWKGGAAVSMPWAWRGVDGEPLGTTTPLHLPYYPPPLPPSCSWYADATRAAEQAYKLSARGRTKSAPSLSAALRRPVKVRLEVPALGVRARCPAVWQPALLPSLTRACQLAADSHHPLARQPSPAGLAGRAAGVHGV